MTPTGSPRLSSVFVERTHLRTTSRGRASKSLWYLESYCREQAQTGNELLIISGPAGFNGDRIPNGPVLIPSHTWKIIVKVPRGSGSVLSRITPATRVIAVDIPNIQGVRHDPWQKYVVSVKEIETLTGYNFFTALAPDLAAGLKAKVDGRWSFSPTLILVAICVLAVLLVLAIVTLVVFFKTRPKR